MPLNGSAIAQKLVQYFRSCQYVMKNFVWRYLVIAYHLTYTLCYVTGVQTMRFARYAGKRMVCWLAPFGRFLYAATDLLVLKHVRRLIAEVKRFGLGFPTAARRVRAEFHRHPLYGCRMVILLPFLAVRRHRKAIFSLINIAAPVAAAFLLVSTINYWNSKTFALAVEYDGETIGYIADESVFDAAATMAAERVINTDNSFEVQRTPKLTIAVVTQSEILDEATVCNKILSSSSDSIAEVTGLYVDGKFEGAVQSRKELDAMLQSLLDGYMNGSANERAEFVQDVQVVDGLYPVSSIISVEDMRSYLTKQTVVDKYYEIVPGDSPLLIASKTSMPLEQLRALNQNFDKVIFPGVKVLIQGAQPYLRVQVVRTVEYTQPIDYATSKVEDSNQYIGYSEVRTQGQEGEQLVKAEVTLLDGLEQSRNILETTVTKAPVDKVIVVGSKKVNPSVSAAGDGVVTGKFVWPLPSCKTISSDFGYRWGGFHSGIDISGNGVYGKDIIAADGGTVVEVNTSGWGGGYGLYVIVDHGGGYRSVYAHCSSILVTAGQKVSQGQLIARAGNTGNSQGAHLHFEIRINGQSVNPKPYVQ